jgi:MerR family transcriptional regulator, thiopeptide resistance regulator
MDYENLMPVGELATKMGVTVRTLQYYDKQGLLKPSSQSEGGRRLYTHKDMIKLNEILSLKFLGFSLEDIKNHLIPLDTPKEVHMALENQAYTIKDKISYLQEALTAIESLQEEIQQIDSVDWEKYSNIISLLRLKNENYWIVKYFDTNTLAKIETSVTEQEAKEIIFTWEKLCDDIILLKSQGELPIETKGQIIAKNWWDMISKFTGGDMNILNSLIKFNNDKNNWNNDLNEKQAMVDDFIGPALMKYFQDNKIQIPNM